MREKFVLKRYPTNLKGNMEKFRHFGTVTYKNCTLEEIEKGSHSRKA
jgi:hypothetical protein